MRLPGLFSILLVLGWSLLAKAQVAVQMAASPSQVSAGAEARASGSGAPSGPLQLRLLNGAGGLLAQSTPFSASDGQFVAALRVPEAAAPGGYTLQLIAAGAPAATAPLTVLPPLLLEIPQAPVALGAQFGFAVEGLRPGQLLLRLNGRSVFGPVAISGSRYEGFARVPIDLAAPGEPVTLEALNLVGTQAIGHAGRRMFLADIPAEAPARLDGLVMPPGGQLRIDEVFEVSGRLQLPRSSPLGLEARLFLRLPEGRMLPFSLLRAPVAADGSFTVKGDLASLHRNGVALPPAGVTGEGFVVFVEPDRGQPGGLRSARQFAFSLGSLIIQAAPGDVNPRLTVEVLDPAGQPLEDVIVVFSVPGPFGGALGQPDLAPLSNSGPNLLPEQAPAPSQSPESLTLVSGNGRAMFHGVSQVRAALDALQQQPGSGVGGGQGCPETLQRGTTDAAGRILAELSLPHLRLLSDVFAVNTGVGQFGNKADIVHEPREIEIELQINALKAAPLPHTFGETPAVPKGGVYRLLFHEQSRSFFGWSEATQGYTVPLGPNPLLSFRTRHVYTGGAVYPLLVGLGSMPKIAEQTYGPVMTFPNPQGYSLNGNFWPVSATTIPTLFGLIEWMRLELVEQGQIVRTWDMGQGSLSCTSDEEVTFIALVDAWTLPHSGPGGLRFRIRVKQPGIPAEQAYTYEFRLRTEPGPDWFLNDSYDQRSVSWAPDTVTLRASKQRPERGVSGTPEGAGMGTLHNRSRATDFFVQQQSNGALDGLVRTSRSENQGANAIAQPSSLSTPQISIWVPENPTEETILDTGTLPLFRFAWGIPPIASATLGADARFWATLTIQARSDIDFDTGTLSASLRTTPKVNGDIKAFFNFSAILGLVTMEASFSPRFSVAMPTVISNDVVAESTACMNFRVWVEYAVSVGVCPVCVGASGGRNAFTPLIEPPGCTVPSALVEVDGGGRLPPLRRVSASFDSLGAGMLVEATGSGALGMRPWTGSGFGAFVPIGQVSGVDQVVHRHHAPGKAVMVYAASTLSQSAFLASTLAEASSSRRMYFRTLRADGSWTNQALIPVPSTPLGGEGKPALAACPAGQAGCPPGGAVYAVWLRGNEADPFSLATEVWGGRFDGTSWSNVQRLADPGSGSDQLPRVTYWNGQPVVSFVRQSQRDIGAASQRRLMLMRIGTDSQPIDLGAPAGVIWQDIDTHPQGQIVIAYTVANDPAALIGDQTVLYAARGTCSGSGCSFSHTRQRDGFGRDILAESPQLVRTEQGVQIAYRGLGYGPDASGQRILPGDPRGTIDGTGEFMSLVPHFLATGNVVPLAVSGNGALHFNPQLVRHPVSGALVGLSNTLGQAMAGAEGLAARVPFEPAEGAAASRQIEADLGEFLLADAPDLRLLSASTTAAWAEPGQLLDLRLLIENRGARLAVPQGGLGLSWGGPWNSGVPQQRLSLPAFGDGASLMFDVEIEVPTALHGRGPRRLHLVLDPDGNSGDGDRSNDEVVLELGALPVPEALAFRSTLDERHALLQWRISEDPRVRGFQVYREFAAQDWQPIGVSEVEGFVDLMTVPGEVYRYRIASYDEDGHESALSAVLTVQPRMRMDTVFADGFEGPEQRAAEP